MEIREFLTNIAGIRVARQSGEEIACYCPWHDDQNASLAINYTKGMWHCFGGCTKGSGGLQGFFRKLDNSGSLSQRYIAMFAGQGDLLRIEIDSPDDKLIGNGYDVNELPMASENDYLRSRGITEDTVREFGIRYHGMDDSIVMPIYIKHEYIGYVRRNISSNPKYLNSKNLQRDQIIYPFDHFKSDFGAVYVCEGPFDALKAHQMGLKNTICTLGGLISDNQCRLIGELGTSIILVVDKDDSGVRIAEANAKKLMKKFGIWVEFTVAPGIAKDFGEANDFSTLKSYSPFQLQAINRDLHYLIRS
jgi:DNA primase